MYRILLDFPNILLIKFSTRTKKKVWGFLISLTLIATSDLGNSDDTPPIFIAVFQFNCT